MKRLRILGALLAALALPVANAAVAAAAPTDPFQYRFQFNTAAIPGIGSIQGMEVNHQSGNVLVWENNRIDQFGPDGNPVDFSGLGSPTIDVGGEGAMKLLVDNSGGATQGNIYVVETSGCCGSGGARFWSYGPGGKPIGSTPVDAAEKAVAAVINARVLSDGNLMLVHTSGAEDRSKTVWTPAGVQVGKKFNYQNGAVNQGGVFDDLGHLYRDVGLPTVGRLKEEPSGALVVEGATGMPNNGGFQAIDPSNRDLLERFQTAGPDLGKFINNIRGVHYTDPLVSQTPYLLIEGLDLGSAFALDGSGEWLYSEEGTPPGGTLIRAYHRDPIVAPNQVGALGVDGIRSSRAVIHATLDTEGADTTFYFEYGPDTDYGQVSPTQALPKRLQPKGVAGAIEGLQPDSVYHVRLVATNSAGRFEGPDRVLKTYAVSGGGADDQCVNALARKQTSAQRLPECRAYELVSAGDTAGFNVESYLVPGQEPFPGFPAAKDRLLYSTHAGAVPGPWNATNKSSDPYLASRTDRGWVTDYKGLPADLGSGSGSFASELGEADSTLDTFAFAGPSLCSPCFGSGLATGIPVRLPSGELVQGMDGSLDPGSNSARPEGKVARYFSADGRHLIFASKYAFEPGANTDGTSLTVYDRDLSAGTTRIVSTDPNGAVLAGAGISGLDISADGSRVVIGKRVSADSEGNEYVHPYMHVGASPASVDLAPGSTSGVLFAGMTADGSTAYFTTADKLLSADLDTSVDLYRADVSSAGALDLSLVTGNSPVACAPVGNDDGAHWNTTGASANCDAVAIGGGGGVVSGGGAIYFLSPEQFSSEGDADQPNLYVAEPGGSPRLVATLEPDNPLVLDSVKSSTRRRTGDFQVTGSGGFATFTSALPLTGIGNFGFRSVFRYDSGFGQLSCSSCDTTGNSDGTLASDAALAPAGLSILEDGSIFSTTRFPLVLNDANGREDVYETTKAGKQELISSGSGPSDSGLLTVSTDGTDAFFFTHDTLAPEEDRNGQLMKIYDARVDGGFFKLPAAVPCKASDECHGPSSPVPPPPDIKSSGRSTVGNALVCGKGKVKHRNTCVKKKHKKSKKKKHKKSGKAKGKKGGRRA